MGRAGGQAGMHCPRQGKAGPAASVGWDGPRWTLLCIARQHSARLSAPLDEQPQEKSYPVPSLLLPLHCRPSSSALARPCPHAARSPRRSSGCWPHWSTSWATPTASWPPRRARFARCALPAGLLGCWAAELLTPSFAYIALCCSGCWQGAMHGHAAQQQWRLLKLCMAAACCNPTLQAYPAGLSLRQALSCRPGVLCSQQGSLIPNSFSLADWVCCCSRTTCLPARLPACRWGIC